jgi:hypothetical protein
LVDATEPFYGFLLYSIIGFINLFKKMRGDKVRKN